jgi:recombination protein RecT
MANETTVGAVAPVQESRFPMKNFFDKDIIKKKFEELLGERSSAFVTSVLQLTTMNRAFDRVKPESVFNSACLAATLNLPVNANLGFAWILPYGDVAQFQLGAKGYIQLAQRTGQYSRINVLVVYESQFTSYNTLTEELVADFSIPESGKVVGYAAYFKLSNGYEKTVYWTKEKVLSHGQKYSKSFNSGPWKTEFDKMAMKTVLKNMLSQWGILSIEMQRAMVVDQAAIKNPETDDVEYIDATDSPAANAGAPTSDQKMSQRMLTLITESTSMVDLEGLEARMKKDFPEHQAIFDQKKNELLDKAASNQG